MRAIGVGDVVASAGDPTFSDQQLQELLALARATDSRIEYMARRLATSEAKRRNSEKWKWPLRIVSAATGFVVSVVSNQVASANWASEAYHRLELAVSDFLSRGIQIPHGGFIPNAYSLPWAVLAIVAVATLIAFGLARRSPSERFRTAEIQIGVERSSMFGGGVSSRAAQPSPDVRYSRRPLTVEEEILRIARGRS